MSPSKAAAIIRILRIKDPLTLKAITSRIQR